MKAFTAIGPPPLHSFGTRHPREQGTLAKHPANDQSTSFCCFRSKINCNHHHLADVESLDIEVKHKKREEKANYLKNHFSLLSFSTVRLFTRSSEKKKSSSLQTSADENQPYTTFPHQKIYIISRSSSRSAWWCKCRWSFFLCLVSFSLFFSIGRPFCIESRCQYQIMTDFLFATACVLDENAENERECLSAVLQCSDSHGHKRYYIISAIFHVPSCFPDSF